MLNLQDYGSSGGAGVDLPIAIEDGGTGATTAEDARDNLGIVAGSTDHMNHLPFFFQATSNGTIGIGLSIGTNGTQADGTDAVGYYRQFTSAASIGAVAGWGASNGSGGYPRITAACYLVFKTGASITDIRILAGTVQSGLSTQSRGDDDYGAAIQPLNAATLRYSTAVDGTAFWRFVTSDALVQSVTTTAVAVAPDTRYEVKIVPGVDDYKCYIDGVLAATNTDNLPDPTILQIPQAVAVSLDGVAKVMKPSRIAIEPTA